MAYAWARETLSKTLLNRRVARTLAAYTILQSVLALGGWLAGFSWQHVHLLFIFCWGLTYTLLAIWVEVWFSALAIACALSFVVACAIPSVMYPLMAFDNLLVTFVVVKVWFPREDAATARFHERRRELGQRARRWLRPSAGEE
jgi:hypothetical protein